MPSHFQWMKNVSEDEKYAEEHKFAVQKLNGATIVAKDSYIKEYDKIAFDAMSEENATMNKLCVSLQRSKATVLMYIKRHPTFRNAIESGRAIGKEKFLKKLAENAYLPSSGVNTSLIKMLASVCYDIKDNSSQPSVVVNNNNSTTIVTKETSKLYEDAIIIDDEPKDDD